MAIFSERFPRNTPGKYYIDSQCTDCDLCRESAPQHIARDDQHGYSYVFRQPTTPEEMARCEEGVKGCPTEAVGNDGDVNSWSDPITYKWPGNLSCPSQVDSEAKAHQSSSESIFGRLLGFLRGDGWFR